MIKQLWFFYYFVDLYGLCLPYKYKSRSGAVWSNTDNIYLRGWKSDIKTDRQMTLISFAAFTIFRNLASFRIGKYVRNNVIENPCTKPCEKLQDSMFISSTCSFQRHGIWIVFSEGVIFSRKYLESGWTLSNKSHLLHKTFKPSRYGVNTKDIKQCRKYGNGVWEATLKGTCR